jgi:hypothetical protein
MVKKMSDVEIVEDATVEPIEDNINEPIEDQDFLEDIFKENETFVDLQHLYIEIKNKGGINKEMAIAIESISTGFINENNTLNSYTTDLSRTNLKSSLEDVIDVIFAFFKTIYKIVYNILAFIYRIFKKIILRSLDKKNETSKTLANIKNIIKDINSEKAKLTSTGKNKLLIKERELNKEFNIEYADLQTGLTDELIFNKAVKTVLIAAGGKLNEYLSNVNEKLTVIDSATSKIDKFDSSRFRNNLSVVEKPMKVGSINSAVSSFTGSKSDIIQIQFPEIKNKISKMKERDGTVKLTLQELIVSIEKDKIKFTDKYFNDSTYIESSLKSIVKKYEKMEKQLTDIDSDNMENLTTYKNGFSQFSKDLHAVKDIFISIDMVVETNNRLATFFYKSVNNVYREVIELNK